MSFRITQARAGFRLAAGRVWILAGGLWSDTGVWKDAENWSDAA